MALWRIHIRPGETNHDQAYKFCLDNNFIGIGWRVNDPSSTELCKRGFSEEDLSIQNIEDYLERAVDIYGPGLHSVRALAQMEIGDLIWMRSPQGIYHLCRALGKWNYNGDNIHRNFDIVNILPVQILEIGLEDNVPGQIVNSFIPSKTVQRIQNDTACNYSEYLWNKKHGTPQHYNGDDIFSLLSPFECEDLVSIYLQVIGYVVYFPPSKRTAISYEYVVRNKENVSDVAVVQVKMGMASIDISALQGRSIVFQPNSQYDGKSPECTIIQRSEMVAFLKIHKEMLPGRIQNFIEWIGIERLQ